MQVTRMVWYGLGMDLAWTWHGSQLGDKEYWSNSGHPTSRLDYCTFYLRQSTLLEYFLHSVRFKLKPFQKSFKYIGSTEGFSLWIYPLSLSVSFESASFAGS